MRKNINNIISVIITMVRIFFLKALNFSNFRFSGIERFSPNVVCEINRGSYVRLGDRISAHSGTKIKVRKGASLIIGDNVKINYNCMIVCKNRIEIGKGTEFGPSVFVYDHDHDFYAEGGLSAREYNSAPITIGKNVWIGANTVILRGTSIGDNCVIGAGSVIKGNYPASSVIIQKRITTVTCMGGELTSVY